MLCDESSEPGLVGASHGVDHEAAAKEEERWHGRHTELCCKLSEHIDINLDEERFASVLVGDRGISGRNSLARPAPTGGEIDHEQLFSSFGLHRSPVISVLELAHTAAQSQERLDQRRLLHYPERMGRLREHGWARTWGGGCGGRHQGEGEVQKHGSVARRRRTIESLIKGFTRTHLFLGVGKQEGLESSRLAAMLKCTGYRYRYRVEIATEEAELA